MCGALRRTKLPMPASDTLETYDAVRAFALSLNLPNVEDSVSWGQPNLKAHGKMWVWWSAKENAPVFKTTFEEREFLIEIDPETFFVTPHYKSWPLILAHPDKLDMGWARTNLMRSWRNQAKKTWLKNWDREQALLSVTP
jgi:hypothetical protein